MSKWLGLNATKFPLKFIPVSTLQQSFPTGIIIVTILLIVIPILAIYKKWDNRILGIGLGIFLVNAMQHILNSIIFLDYSPGVITAVIINIPLSIFMIRQLFKHNLLKNFSWFHIFVYGAIGFVVSLALIWCVTLLIYYASI